MYDGKRKLVNGIPQIDFIILHHTAGDEGKNLFDSGIRQSLNSIGYNRGYKKLGYDFSTGYSSVINPDTGKPYGQNYKYLIGGGIGFAEYHYTIHAYDLDKASPYFNKGGYRIVQLLDDPMHCDAGSTENYDYNSRAIAISFCGDYEENNINPEMIDYFISLFKPIKELHWIIQHNPFIKIKGHKDIDPTKCPGVYLYSYIPLIEREIQSIAKGL